MKILILSSYFGNVLGGALNFITELYIELESRNHKVTLLLDERYKDLFSDKKFNIISKVLNENILGYFEFSLTYLIYYVPSGRIGFIEYHFSVILNCMTSREK